MNQPPRTFQVNCPQCQAATSVPAASAGTTITCSDCLEDFIANPTVDRTRPSASPSAPTLNSLDTDTDSLERLLNPSLDATPADSGTIRLDDDLSSDDYPTHKKQTLESDYEFSIACSICGTRLDVNDSLIGKKVKCPDCHNPIAIRTPRPDKRRTPVHASPSDEDDDDFGLGNLPAAVATPSPYNSIANDLLAKAESEVAQETPAASQPKRDPVLDSLQRAKESLDEADEHERPKLPDAPLRTGVMKFLIDPLSIARLLVLGLVLFVVLGAIQAAIVSANEGPQSQFMSVLYRMFAIPVGAVFLTNLAVSLLGILQDTANGKDQIESWPDINFLDWLGDAFYMSSGLFIAVFPACFIAKLLNLAGAPDALFWLVSILGSAAGIIALFPFVLVSMLESGSPLAVVSTPIRRSLRLACGSWIVFTIMATLLVGVGLCLAAVRILWPDYAVMNFILAVLLIVVFALYFRLLGRLTWCCDEAVLAEDIRLEEAAEASEN
ncbi:MAG: hypothetical protein H8E66_15720 [Planctomycetes bacterium]|nr:hypothetical protein [Planctomycetota bacterium]